MTATAPNTDCPLPEGVPTLDSVYFYLTQGCNLACRHCWLAPGYDPDGAVHPVLPVETFRRVIEEAKPLGLSGVKLTGGEPLLHPQFTELLDIVQSAELRPVVETNGLLCSRAIADRIAACPDPFVSVSLDGTDAATHDWLRGVQGSFTKAVSAIEHLVAAGAPPQIIMTLTPRNAGQVEEMVRLAEGWGAASVKFNLIQPTARGRQLHEQGDVFSIEELLRIGETVDGRLTEGTTIDLHYDYPAAFRPLSRIARNRESCHILSILGVLATGHYALCGIGMHIPDLAFGEIGLDSLEVLWQTNPVLAELREGLPHRLSGICSHCLMKQSCLGACVAQNAYRGGGLWQPFWFCEQAAAVGLFPSTRLDGSTATSDSSGPRGE